MQGIPICSVAAIAIFSFPCLFYVLRNFPRIQRGEKTISRSLSSPKPPPPPPPPPPFLTCSVCGGGGHQLQGLFLNRGRKTHRPRFPGLKFNRVSGAEKGYSWKKINISFITLCTICRQINILSTHFNIAT